MSSTALVKTRSVDGLTISYVDTDVESDLPPVILLPGWCGDHRGFAQLIEYLRGERRVICVNWRGHGVEPYPVPDFGCQEQAADALALLNDLQLDTFVPVSHSHGGWALLELLDQAGADRAPRAVVLDWLMRSPTPDFADSLRRLQEPDGWLNACRDLFRAWLPGPDHEPMRREMEARASAYGYEMWSRSGRVISTEYAAHGSPMLRMAKLRTTRPIRHLFSHPQEPEYEALQADFALSHPWFTAIRLGGSTHFPAREIPDVVAGHIR